MPTRAERGHRPPGRKVCTKCLRDLPAKEFHARRSVADGLQSRCKDCMRESARDQYLKQAQGQGNAARPYRDNWRADGRRCTSCGEWKGWTDFNRNVNGHQGRASRCKECTREKSKAQYQKDPGGYARDARERRALCCAVCTKRCGTRLCSDCAETLRDPEVLVLLAKITEQKRSSDGNQLAA